MSDAQQDMTTTTNWSISVKTVGQADERNVTVQVSPDDHVRSLYDKIESATGVKANQQRLIYRGRLIAEVAATSTELSQTQSEQQQEARQQRNENEGSNTNDAAGGSALLASSASPFPKIKDIAGLQDGHTIHLVRKRDNPDGERAESSVAANSNNDRTDNSSGNSTGTGLLAALLGMGSSESSAEDENSDIINISDSNEQQPRGVTSLRRFGSSRRRFHYRLTAEDFQVRDPGSMEHVRQGLLTLHTMLPPAMSAAAVSDSTQPASPLDLPRPWFIGQWVDCRDTVNQWLEATIIDICTPDELLPPPRRRSRRQVVARLRQRSPTVHPPNDPIVAATDLAGRVRLLVEPCDEGDSTTNNSNNDNNNEDEGDLGGNLAGFRRRRNNDGVQLLLIHYNGWPERWDEWIRSDSERIRPFRVRTRHPATSTTALPSPVSHYAESPSTHIRVAAEDEMEDRYAMLPELSRLLDTVNDMVSHAAAAVADRETPPGVPVADPDRVLPWIPPPLAMEPEVGDNEEEEEDGDEQAKPAATQNNGEEDDCINDRSERNETSDNKKNETLTTANRRQLEALAPLLDRLGRTLVDAAPHVAALAASIPDDAASATDNAATSSTNNNSHGTLEPIEENTNTLGGLLSLLNRDRRRRNNNNNSNSNNDQDSGSNDNRRSVRRRQSNDSSNMAVSSVATEEATTQSNASANNASFDPDYTDFASGVVNTSRGEVRSGPRSRRSSSSNSISDDVASLLGAYLAAASLASISGGDGGADGEDNDDTIATGLGRLLRNSTGGSTRGGGSGGGIDIHIHAVVTAPGAGGGGTLGILAPMGALGATDLTRITNTATTTAAANNNNNNNNNSPGSAFANLFSSHRNERRSSSASSNANRTSEAQDEEDMGIFDELYSETPDPVDPNASPVAPTSNATVSNESRQSHREEPASASASSSSNIGSATSTMRRSRHAADASSLRNGSNNNSGNGGRRGGNMISRWFRRPTPDR